MAWNAAGHEIVAQIAFVYLSEPAKAKIATLIGRANRPLKSDTFMRAAIWMDAPKQRLNSRLRMLHYIDWPYSQDGSSLVFVDGPNALQALNTSTALLNNPNTAFREKQKQLKILLHVLGDIHQPLHSITKISRLYPEGDKGGNLTAIYATRVSHNLHGFWDKGGAYLLAPKKNRNQWLKATSAKLMKQYPCRPSTVNYKAWVLESHMLAITYSYGQFPTDAVINQSYQDNTERLSKQQVSLAACRLATSLNNIFR